MVLATPDDKLRAVGLSFAKIASIKDLAREDHRRHGAAL